MLTAANGICSQEVPDDEERKTRMYVGINVRHVPEMHTTCVSIGPDGVLITPSYPSQNIRISKLD
jgi:hypothetical protein